MPKERILVVDDEKDILELIEYNLSKEGFTVDCVESGEAALEFLKKIRPSLIVLDIMMPGIDGLGVCKALKRDDKYSNIPIIMLTAKGEDIDIVTGLELGADDYITKPFSPKVLIARIRTALRKTKVIPSYETKVIHVNDLTIDPGRHEVLYRNKKIELTKSEFLILYFLAQKPGRVYTREQIIDAAKGEDYPATDRSVDVQIVGLRRKLGKAGEYIETVRGVGYRFKG